MIKVWVNGTFDVLHIGHIRLLEHAYQHGFVRVGIDTDERIKSLKSVDRPFNSLADRKEFLESIKFVTDVVSFDTDEELIERIKEYEPNIMVIGDDYKDKNIIGSEFIPKIIFYKRVPDKSTTNILNFTKK